MKKYLSIILTVAILLSLAALFSSCGNNEEEPAPTYVYLTADNFNEYFAVNVSYDYQMVHLGQDSYGYDHYDIFCTVTITTAPNGDYKYSDASVEYKYFRSQFPDWELPSSLATIAVNIGADGYSAASFVAVKRDTTSIGEYTFDRTNKHVIISSYVNVSGCVIIPPTYSE